MARRLYLDCDGVLADFDKGATGVLGLPPRAYEKRHGLGRFWQKLASAPDFYFGLPLLPDATVLFDAVRHLHPVILTELPRGNWAADQKVRWAAQHFPGTRIITTMARDKRVVAVDGSTITLQADTMCLHGDTPGAAALAREIRRGLESAGVRIAALRG